MNTHSNELKSRCGFTLIEILVVLALVSLLAALLLSAFSAVREKSRQTICASNLKQIGVAFQMYADDNDHYMPPTVTVNSANQMITWGDLTLPYTKTKQVYVCPTDPLQKEQFAGWVISYGYNHHVAGVLGFGVPASDAENRPKTDGQILKPSATVLVTDAGTTSTSGLPPLQWPLKDPTPFQIGDAFTHDGDNPSTGMMPAPHARHSGRTNILWADGHVNSLPIEAFYNSPDHLRPGDRFTGISPCLRPDMGCP